mmetsp:Transcript_48291/g.87103  ORF Transcript_48291/g.87103 Transcript_48291/m.87103 type:complete len:226 (-) Transcript_48291:914-1591(-)
MVSRSCVATKDTVIPSFSVEEIAVITSTSTPKSMYIIVTEAKRTKNKHMSQIPVFSSSRSCRSFPSSGKMKFMMSTLMECGTDSNKVEPSSESAVSCRKTMAKTNMIIIQSRQKTATDLAAKPMPFTMITSSGIARRSFAMRERRSILTMRTIRSIERSTWRIADSRPAATTTRERIQVSITIRLTSKKSKTNQPSLKALIFRSKAPKRMTNSAKKYVQKMFSPV